MWRNLDKLVDAGLVDLRNSIIQAFEEYPKQCEKLGAPTAFLECIKARHNALDHVATSAKDDFKKQYGVIKRNANVSQEESYVRNWMHPAYREAFAITGKHFRPHTFRSSRIGSRSLSHKFRPTNLLHLYFLRSRLESRAPQHPTDTYRRPITRERLLPIRRRRYRRAHLRYLQRPATQHPVDYERHPARFGQFPRRAG